METWVVIVVVILFALLVMNKNKLRMMYNKNVHGGCDCDRTMEYGMRGGGRRY
jgi:hypothetical protein